MWASFFDNHPCKIRCIYDTSGKNMQLDLCRLCPRSQSMPNHDQTRRRALIVPLSPRLVSRKHEAREAVQTISLVCYIHDKIFGLHC